MGCVGSRFDERPITGHKSEFVVIPESRSRYVKQETTVLKLREKMFCWNGDDYTIKV